MTVDEFRQDAAGSFDDADSFEAEDAPRAKSKLILGMTAPQRFMISVMLLMWVCTVSVFLLLAIDKIAF
jgi:hypothetical protein